MYCLRAGVRKDSSGVYQVLAGATLIEGVYLAQSLQPNHELVTEALSSGVPSTLVLRRETPAWALTWIKNNHNFFNPLAGSLWTLKSETTSGRPS